MLLFEDLKIINELEGIIGVVLKEWLEIQYFNILVI